MKKLILLIASLLLTIPHLVMATDYYVDYISGADTNAGTSTITAFQHCPGDDSATDIADSTTLSGGDVIYFKGGVSYLASPIVDIDWSGSSGNQITYDGNTSGDWGTGRAVMDGQNATNTRAFEALSTRNYITIQGFEITEFGGYPNGSEPADTCSNPQSSGPGGSGINFDGGSTGVVIQNNYIHEVGNWQNREPFEDGAITGGGIRFKGATSNAYIYSNTIYRAAKLGMGFYPNTNDVMSSILIEGNDISHNIVWGIDISPEGDNGEISITIKGNDIHDYEEFDDSNWLGCGEKPHTDGIFIRNNYDGVDPYIVNVNGNSFYSTSDSGGGTAAIYVSTGPSANIYNNRFIYPMKGRTIAILYGASSGDPDQVINIDNNSFLLSAEAISLRNAVRRTTNIRNNIFHDVRTSTSGVAIYSEDAASEPDVLEYNQYYPNDVSSPDVYRRESAWKDFGELQIYGYEVYGAEGDPLYTDIQYGIGETTYLNDLTLQSESPAINAGTTVGYFSSDYDDVARPQGAKWDMGAYEFGSGNGETYKTFGGGTFGGGTW